MSKQQRQQEQDIKDCHAVLGRYWARNLQHISREEAEAITRILNSAKVQALKQVKESKMNKRKEVYRLPTIEYKTTTSVRKYINAWRATGQPVARKFSCRLVGFDPDFLLAHRNGQSFTLPLWAALEFKKQKDGE